jgi:hypothetical protein
MTHSLTHPNNVTTRKTFVGSEYTNARSAKEDQYPILRPPTSATVWIHRSRCNRAIFG